VTDLDDLPRVGWRCTGVDDLGEEPTHRTGCEVCGTLIRFVHNMVHTDDPRTVDVGCVCAGKMSGDIEGAESREKDARNRASRRRTWLIRDWRRSKKGNEYLRLNGIPLVVFPSKFGGWCYSINGQFSPRSYDTADAAKLAMFEAIQ